MTGFDFERPLVLLLAVPWLAFWWWFRGVQRHACRTVWRRVDPRAWTAFTVFVPKARAGLSLARHLGVLAVLGLVLVAAAARPTFDGETDARPTRGRVVLLIDASASMGATDVVVRGGSAEGTESESRFEAAKRLAHSLVDRLVDDAFAVVTWSGEATLQLPMTTDRASLDEALRVVEVHNIYRKSGSRLGNALDHLIHFAVESRDDLQAVILSDGEQPDDAAYATPLAALAARGVAVHAVAIGSVKGQGREIYDFRDVIAGKEERRVLQTFTTRRVDDHLRAIARATDGTFGIAGPETVAQLADAIRARHQDAAVERTEGRRSLAPWLVAIFLVGFLLVAIVTRRPPPRLPSFDLDRLGLDDQGLDYQGIDRQSHSRQGLDHVGAVSGTVVLLGLLAFVAGCQVDDPADLAARENEQGNRADRRGRYDEARVHYERSIAFGIRAEIPTHNLGRTLARQGAFSEAHAYFQRALVLAPDLSRAHFNDGWTLVRWGEAERDPRGCDLDRTLELWRAARGRFVAAADLASIRDGRQRARDNLRAIEEAIAVAESLVAAPPPACQSQASTDGAEGDAGGDAGGSNEDNTDNNEGGSGGGSGDAEGDSGGPGDDPDDDDGTGSEGGRGDDGTGTESERPTEAEGPAPLTAAEREQIAEALARIRAEAQQEGAYHRRSLAEQFPAESWQSPDDEISW